MSTIALDFGTSTTLCAEREGLSPCRVLPIGQSRSYMPTIASVTPDRVLIGENAVEQPESTLVRSVKTLLATGAQHAEVLDSSGLKHRVSVDDLVSEILQHTRKRAALAGADSSVPVRLGCPAMWAADPRQRLARLARDAGFQASVEMMLDEPIAAGISWIWNTYVHGESYPEGRVLVFDFGGGTLDVALLDIERASTPRITALASVGNDLAGDRIDEAIKDHLLRTSGMERVENELHRTLVGRASNRLKEQLTVRERASTFLGGELDGVGELTLERDELRALASPIMREAFVTIERCLKAARLRSLRQSLNPEDYRDVSSIRSADFGTLAADVDYVLLAGGMSKAVFVAEHLRMWFPHAGVVVDPGIESAEEAVVSGLTVSEVISDLNLDRPAFSFEVTYRDRRTGEKLGTETVYDAFSPLYRPGDVVRRAFGHGHRYELSAPGKREVVASLLCRGLDGEALPLKIDDEDASAVEVLLGSGGGVFTLFVNGRVSLRGKERADLFVERWPATGGERALSLRSRQTWHPQEQNPNWWVGGE